MCFPKEILNEILYFLDWEEFYQIIKSLDLNIQHQLKQYGKRNNSLDALTIDNICNMKAEYLGVIKYLHKIHGHKNGKECTDDAMDNASMNGHLEIVKYLHENGKECSTNAIDWASEKGHLEIVKYLKSIKK